MIIGIIGAGASGMAAALAASENPNNTVILMERQARVGRKLQATGNGRCNLTNLHADGASYHGDAPAFAAPAMAAFNVQKTLSWFSSLGLCAVAEESGRVYPYSDQANSVVDVLRFALHRPNIILKTGFEEQVHCDRLIIACGGLAGTKLGGSMSGYQLLRGFGHKITKLRPALVQIKTHWGANAALKGVRANCRAQILRDGAVAAQSEGELQFTEYGLSGPVIFEVSRDVCRDKGEWSCRLDFIPMWEEDELLAALRRRQETDLSVEELLTGILHNRLGRVLTHAAGINSGLIRDLREEELKDVVRVVKDFRIPLAEPMGMDSAQVTAGGAVTGEFDSETMESRLMPGLYACGEVLDIDGDCGGYNLQWAWSSGHLAGQCAGKE